MSFKRITTRFAAYLIGVLKRSYLTTIVVLTLISGFSVLYLVRFKGNTILSVGWESSGSGRELQGTPNSTDSVFIDNGDKLAIMLRKPHIAPESKNLVARKFHTLNPDVINRPNLRHILPLNMTCPVIPKSKSDFDSTEVYPTLKFNMQNIWDNELEQRYLQAKPKFPLEIIIVPHSHNDPGWGWTIEDYFTMWTKDILNHLVEKMPEHKNMTFQWSEMSFLDLWWKIASRRQKKIFKQLIEEGRLEIITGGWVMTDEAVVHVYSMITQLIDGHEWLNVNLGVSLPKAGWSVDPFGLGSVMPYVLKNSQIDSMLILRVHYAWKKWLANKQYGDFRWMQRWNLHNTESQPILCHHHPYEMYTMEKSLGPHPPTGNKFNFIESIQPVTSQNVEEFANDFIMEASRTGSLSRHNVILVILGGDFRFRNLSEWDSSYFSYMKLFEHINSNPDLYNQTHAQFGTVSTFFKVVRERQPEESFPSFSGDFFTYSDVITDEDGRGAYWSGFFSSRPYWKKLYREAEASLRSTEILYTLSRMNSLKEKTGTANCYTEAVAKRMYKWLQTARHHISLFAHHDGAPGVSNTRVMMDYGIKLNEAKFHIENIQMKCISCLITSKVTEEGRSISLVPSQKFPPRLGLRQSLALNFTEKLDSFGETKSFHIIEKKIVVFNSLTWSKFRLITVLVTHQQVQVIGPYGDIIPSQINPIPVSPNPHDLENVTISSTKFELVFYYKLEPLSLTTFRIVAGQLMAEEVAKKPSVYFRNLSVNETDTFNFYKIAGGNDLIIFNNKYKLNFNSTTGMLKSAKLLQTNETVKLNLKFGGYSSVRKHSGPYLFMPKDELKDLHENPFTARKPTLILIEGPLQSKLHIIVTSVYHQVVELHSVFPMSKDTFEAEEGDGIFIRNFVHTGENVGEFFMRFDTDLKNEGVLYTDQSGFTFEARSRVKSIGLEGNYYPITTMGYIYDYERGLRLSLIVERAHGISSWVDGRVEVMIERRVLDDDERGIGQGVTDNLPTVSNYILRLETHFHSKGKSIDRSFQSMLPTLSTHHLSQQLNYPLQIYFVDERKQETSLVYKPLVTFFKDYVIPTDTHLLSWRIQPSTSNLKSPSKNSLMILQKFGYSCNGNTQKENNYYHSNPESFFHTSSSMNLKNVVSYILNAGEEFMTIKKTDLTGLKKTRDTLYNKNDNIFVSKPFQISSFVLGFSGSSA